MKKLLLILLMCGVCFAADPNLTIEQRTADIHTRIAEVRNIIQQAKAGTLVDSNIPKVGELQTEGAKPTKETTSEPNQPEQSTGELDLDANQQEAVNQIMELLVDTFGLVDDANVPSKARRMIKEKMIMQVMEWFKQIIDEK